MARALCQGIQPTAASLADVRGCSTELFHLVGDTHAEMEAACKFIRSGALTLGTIEDTELPQVHSLMSRYRDRPMDFADATLVFLAQRESLSVILTVDHADYRIEGKRRFRILPNKPPGN